MNGRGQLSPQPVRTIRFRLFDPIAATDVVSLNLHNSSDRCGEWSQCRNASHLFAFFRSFWARLVMGMPLQHLK
jgi:hypothetical protein